MTWWLVTDFDATASGVVSARWVKAESAEEAADAALPELQESWDANDSGNVETVFAAKIDGERVAFEVVSTVRVAELQCCGGIGGGRHSAKCPTAPKDMKGLG